MQGNPPPPIEVSILRATWLSWTLVQKSQVARKDGVRKGGFISKKGKKKPETRHDVPPLRATWLSRFLDRARATRAYLLLLAGGRVWQVAAEGGPPPTTARATCAYSLPTRLRASMPNSRRGRHADDDSVRYPRLHVA